MQIQSLGYRTDLFFARFDSEVQDRGDYIVVRTPSNPTFFWGNFLLFAAPPAAGDFERWQALFAQEIGSRSAVHHLAFGWDSTTGETGEAAPFLEAGFRLEEAVVLTACSVHRPAKHNQEIVIRTLTEDWEWDAALANQVACRDPEYGDAGWRIYTMRKMERYRAMARKGLGAWFGAFLGGQLVGDLGMFVEGDIGRFQSVGTYPDFRRRGVCGTLVFHAAVHALEKMQVQTLVMVADLHYHAARIYESVGFAAAERQTGLTWWQKG